MKTKKLYSSFFSLILLFVIIGTVFISIAQVPFSANHSTTVSKSHLTLNADNYLLFEDQDDFEHIVHAAFFKHDASVYHACNSLSIVAYKSRLSAISQPKGQSKSPLFIFHCVIRV
jgi:hypothetical protein